MRTSVNSFLSLFSLSITSLGSLAKASFVGPKIVNGPENRQCYKTEENTENAEKNCFKTE